MARLPSVLHWRPFQTLQQLLQQSLQRSNRLFYYLNLVMGTIVLVLMFNCQSPAPAQLPLVAVTDSNLSSGLLTEAPEQLTQTGRERYQSGQYVTARELWQQAAIAFAARGDRLNQAMVLSNLALAYRQLGQWMEANQAIENSLQLLNTMEIGNFQDRWQVTAQALTNQGILMLAQGQTEKALDSWQQATQIYDQLGDWEAKTRSLLNVAKALRTLGFYRRASQILEQATQELQTQVPHPLQVLGLLRLGDIQRAMGNLKASQSLLEQALATAKVVSPPLDVAPILLSFGNTARLQKKTELALNYYQQAASLSTTSEVTLQSRLNQLRLLLDTNQLVSAQKLLPDIEQHLAKLPVSRATIYAQINYTQSHILLSTSLSSTATLTKSDLQLISTRLAKTAQQAKELGDMRAESYALGYLGHLYERTHQFLEAQKLTEQALTLAHFSHAPEIAYRWQWQLGRILSEDEQNDNSHKANSAAIAAYDAAIKTLQTLRHDLVSINQDVQFSFRESVEPVYRQLVSLLLLPTDNSDTTERNLQKAREVIESLQLAELDNYFREACLNATSQQVDEVDPQAAVLYPIILPDRLEVILSLPHQKLTHYAIPIPQSKLYPLLDQIRLSLRRTSSKTTRLTLARQMYDFLIRPAEADLTANGIKTLAFVLDGPLRNLPMAALHDGQHYLLEKYAISLTPGLQLLKSQPLAQKRLNVLVGGLTEAVQGFSPLPGVREEVKQIQVTVSSNTFLNQAFTSNTIQDQLTRVPFPVVHLATHGRFSSDAENTFVLMWDRQLPVKELGELLRTRSEQEPTAIELLVLSACQTAAGDDRAALGLAGVAVRSGARSTLATLWSVDDDSTSRLMVAFYQRLIHGQLTRAEALRQAQLSLLRQPGFQHPFYWAPFILVGNWL